MRLILFLVATILSIFSTAVMSYVAMATPIGPWIAPTLVLCAMLVFKVVRSGSYTENTVLATVAGSIGGILATGLGFSLPTLYFLDPGLFNSWMANPVYFVTVVMGLALVGGIFGLVTANLFEERLIVEERLVFPIGQLVYKMVGAPNQLRKAYELITGFVGTICFCILQDGLHMVPRSLLVVPALRISLFLIPPIVVDIWPMLWAIGFVTGFVIALPLAVGACAKIFLVDPINFSLFPNLSNIEFVFAFCSGMVLCGALLSFIELPRMVITLVKNMRTGKLRDTHYWSMARFVYVDHKWEVALCLILFFLFFSYLKLSLIAQLYLIIFTFIVTYQIAVIAGKMGLAPLGRFATFVMIPAMALFSLDFVQIVFIATFVEIAGGVAADVLFGRKVGRLAMVDHRMVKRYQYLGLIITAVSIGLIFWLLIDRFHLGSAHLFAYKAKSRQLLIHAKQFNYYVLLIGALFGLLLKYIKVNPVLVLGGLLMPLNLSIGLIIGGMIGWLVANREDWDPLWSGVFAANSFWMLIKAIL